MTYHTALYFLLAAAYVLIPGKNGGPVVNKIHW